MTSLLVFQTGLNICMIDLLRSQVSSGIKSTESFPVIALVEIEAKRNSYSTFVISKSLDYTLRSANFIAASKCLKKGVLD